MTDKIVEGEIVAEQPSSPERAKAKTFFHPASGALILGVDWLAFGLDLFSGFAALAVVSVASFVVTFYGVLAIQRRWHGDKPGAASLKALLGALAAGVPFPVTGTIVGAAILALSGLPTSFKKR